MRVAAASGGWSLLLSIPDKQSEHCFGGRLAVVETRPDGHKIPQLVYRALPQAESVLVDLARQYAQKGLADLVVSAAFLADAVEECS